MFAILVSEVVYDALYAHLVGGSLLHDDAHPIGDGNVDAELCSNAHLFDRICI